jgi:hypothetical protein
MKKDWLVKTFAMGIVVLFISTGFIPITNGLSQQKQELADNKISDSTVSNNEGKPDLVIEDIFLWSDDIPWERHFECNVKNIGDANTPWYWSEVEVSVKVYWLLFGKIPILPILSDSTTIYVDVILPGETINLIFASCDALPKFGSYRIYLTVNPHKIIEESNYDNNKYSEDWKVFFGQWRQI